MDHSPDILAALSQLPSRRGDVLQRAQLMVLAGGGNLYKVDLFTIGAAKRTVSLSAGFEALVKAYNIVCARALVRMQIDTALRFSALSLVDDPEAFADAVLGDERIDRLTDRNGERLRDAYLVERLVGVAPWLPEVYARTSAYIHLSGQHIFSAIQHLDDETRTISMLVPFDYSYALIDLTVYGRQESSEDSPPGWPQQCSITRTNGGGPDWPPVASVAGLDDRSQWPRLATGRSDDLDNTPAHWLKRPPHQAVPKGRQR